MEVHGVDLDEAARCAHWRSASDVLAIRMKCCDRWVACIDCHEAVADHPARVWPREERHEHALLCGICGATRAIAEYLDDPSGCPTCGTGFNPGCVRHHPLYFQI